MAIKPNTARQRVQNAKKRDGDYRVTIIDPYYIKFPIRERTMGTLRKKDHRSSPLVTAWKVGETIVRHFRYFEMPFGKHQGEQLRHIPLQYLQWVQININLREPLKSAIAYEIRCQSPKPAADVNWAEDWDDDDSDDDDWDEFDEPQRKQHKQSTALMTIDVKAWYRTLAAEFHPDRRRGSPEGMKAIQRARELLEEMLNTKAR